MISFNVQVRDFSFNESSQGQIEGWKSNNREYGARPLRRAIKDLVEIPYSHAILEGRFKKGDFIRAFGESGKVIFEKKSN